MQTAERANQSRREKTVWRRIVSAAVAVSSATTLVKIAGAAKVVVVARAFGTSRDLDAYLLAFLFPSFLGDVVAAASGPALIPLFLEAVQGEGIARAWRLLGGFLAATLAGSFLLSALLAFSAPSLVALIGTGFAPETLALSSRMLTVMAPIVVFGGMGAVWRAALNATGEFAAPATTFAITPAAIMIFVAAGGMTGNIWPLVYGTVAGSAVESVAAACLLARRGASPIPRWHGWDPLLNRAASQYWPVFASSIVMGSAAYVQQTIAASLGPGSVSALNYGTRLPLFLLALGASSLGIAVLPPFSELAARGQEALLRSTLRRTLRLLAWLSVPVAGAAIFVSEPLVRLLFQHGQFSTLDTQLVTRLQQFYLLQVPLALPAAVLARLFATLRAARLLLAASGISLAAHTIFGLAFARLYGIEGLAFAASASALCYLAFLLAMLSRTGLPRA